MPFSHDKKALFIHIPRTGGSSVEVSLAIPPTERDPSRKDTKNLFGPSTHGYLQHYTLSQLIDERLLNEQQRSDYVVFSFVRNPWDRLVSAYFYNFALKSKGGEKFYTFSDMLELLPNLAAERQHFFPMHRYVCLDDSLAVDFLGRYEQLEEDFQRVCSMLDLSPQKLIHCNASQLRKDFCDDYRKLYTPAQVDLVASVYEKDIELFGYDYS